MRSTLQFPRFRFSGMALAVGLLALVSGAACANSSVPSAESGEVGDGKQKSARFTLWQVLFDGNSTDQWRGYRRDTFPEKGWVVEDGWLRVVAGGGGGDIISVGEYENFEFELEWKAAKDANSGIMYLTGEEEGAPWMTAPEYQILDDGEAHSASDISAGAMYALYAPEKKTLHPAGKVNRARIVVASNRIDHYLNGVLVCSAVRGSKDWNERVAKSKFGSMARFGTLDRGHISLQDHGNDVWFRNIRIRELSPAEAALGKRARIDLFNGRDLAGWTCHLNDTIAKLEDTWHVADGLLVCKGTPAGYLMTAEEHTNYHLVVEWRWNPETKRAGNSGVLMRKVGPDKVWPKSIEAQLMSGRAGDFYSIGEFPMETDPTRRNGRHTAHLRANEHPAGEWNRYDITVDGEEIELRVNGVLLNRATGCEVVPGAIGLQSEGTEIQFRTVRIYPAEAASRS